MSIDYVYFVGFTICKLINRIVSGGTESSAILSSYIVAKTCDVEFIMKKCYLIPTSLSYKEPIPTST